MVNSSSIFVSLDNEFFYSFYLFTISFLSQGVYSVVNRHLSDIKVEFFMMTEFNFLCSNHLSSIEVSLHVK